MEIKISDCTLRDGNHAVGHSIDKQQIKDYVAAASKTGVSLIEVGHGNGLGASSSLLGFSSTDDATMFSAAKDESRGVSISTHVIPGFAKFSDIDLALNCGVDVFRVASHCSEADVTESYIKKIADAGREVFGVLMMSHMVTTDELLNEANKMCGYGATSIVIMDSAGYYLPYDVRERVSLLKQTLGVEIGFHAHNNLGMAVANSVAAIDAGASLIDASIKGFGAGAGNVQLEVLAAVLQKMDVKTALNIEEVMKLSSSVESWLVDKAPEIRYTHILSGVGGLFSGFVPHIESAVKNYRIDIFRLFERLQGRGLVAGQEDAIVEEAVLLSKEGQ